MKILFETFYGSRLYGTQTPESDKDIKYIFLPEIDDLLMGNKIQNTVKKTNTVKNTRNSSEDVDEEYIPLQIFARDFVEGQTYALELAFSVESNHANQKIHDNGQFTQSKFIPFIRDLRSKFLTSNIKAMVGYAVNQASIYSFKGERLNVVKEVKKVLEEISLVNENLNISEVADDYRWELIHNKYPKYFNREEYDIGSDRYKPCFVVLEKTIPYTVNVKHALSVINALDKKYGARAEQASVMNVDWKAIMHAVRIIDEGIELLQNHKISFPLARDKVEYLLSIKTGEVPIEHVKDEMSEKLEKLKDLEKTTSLPECNQKFLKEFDFWMKNQLRVMYNLN